MDNEKDIIEESINELNESDETWNNADGYHDNNSYVKSELTQNETTNDNEVIVENKRFNPQGFNKNPLSSGMSSNNNMFGPRFGHFNKGKVVIIFLVIVIVIAVVVGLFLLLK